MGLWYKWEYVIWLFVKEFDEKDFFLLIQYTYSQCMTWVVYLFIVCGFLKKKN